MRIIFSYCILFSLFFACKNAATPKVQDVPLDSVKGDTVHIDPPTAIESSLYTLDSTLSTLSSLDTNRQINNTMQMVADFDKKAAPFKRDTFDISEQTSEGGQIIIVQDSSANFIKLIGTIFGEMGKKEFQYYITKDENAKLGCAFLTDIHYDRPMYQNEMKISGKEKTYEIYANNKLVAVLNAKMQKQKLTHSALKTKELETLAFFKTYIGQIKKGS